MNENYNHILPTQIDYQTELGAFTWYPNWQAFNEILTTRLFDAIANAEQKSAYSEAYYLTRQYIQRFLQANLQHAVIQAMDELTALAKARGTRGNHGKDKLAKQTADLAKASSLTRLRATGSFPKPKRGERVRPELEDVVKQIIVNIWGFERQVIDVIKQLLQENKKPTMSAIAEELWKVSNRSNSDFDTGERMLSKKLQKLRLGKKGKEVLKELVESAKTELKRNNLGVRDSKDTSRGCY